MTHDATSSTTRPLVSVVMPTRNYGQYIAQAIESVLAQEPFGGTAEILVADDGSTDQTEQEVAKFGPVVRYQKLNQVGVGAARNWAIEHARADLLAFLDADDRWRPDKLRLQLPAFDNPRVGLVHAGYTVFRDDGSQDPPTIWDPPDRFHGPCFPAMFAENGVATSSVVIRRSTLPPWNFYLDMPISQDYALWLHILARHEAAYVPQPLIFYRKHAAQTTHERRRRWRIYQAVGRLRVLDDSPDGWRPPQHDQWREQTLQQLREDSYEFYWRSDWEWARIGFRWMRRYGLPVPWRHRLRAWLGDKRR